MREIKLSSRYKALVDDRDYGKLSQLRWRVGFKDKRADSIYAYTVVRMEHAIIGLNPSKKAPVIHLNHNTLDNRRSNLRLGNQCLKSIHNRKCRVRTASKHKGVDYQKNLGKWRARVYVNGIRKHLGYFKTENEAGSAYNKAVRKVYGEFSVLNEV